eukprot:Gb_12804 [translate_table: standard]
MPIEDYIDGALRILSRVSPAGCRPYLTSSSKATVWLLFSTQAAVLSSQQLVRPPLQVRFSTFEYKLQTAHHSRSRLLQHWHYYHIKPHGYLHFRLTLSFSTVSEGCSLQLGFLFMQRMDLL